MSLNITYFNINRSKKDDAQIGNLEKHRDLTTSAKINMEINYCCVQMYQTIRSKGNSMWFFEFNWNITMNARFNRRRKRRKNSCDALVQSYNAYDAQTDEWFLNNTARSHSFIIVVNASLAIIRDRSNSINWFPLHELDETFKYATAVLNKN